MEEGELISLRDDSLYCLSNTKEPALKSHTDTQTMCVCVALRECGYIFVCVCVPVIIKEKDYKFESRVIGQTRERKERNVMILF